MPSDRPSADGRRGNHLRATRKGSQGRIGPIEDRSAERREPVSSPRRHRETAEPQLPGHVKNRDQLMDAAYGETIYVDDRTIDSHIKRVRRKFREVDPEFEQIETLYGIGYRYRDS